MTCGNAAFATWGSWVRIPSSPPRIFKGRSDERPFYLPLRGSPALQLGLQSSLAYRQYASLLFQANLKRRASARCPGLTNDSFVAEICLESGGCLAFFVLHDKVPSHAGQVQIGCKYFLDAPLPAGLFVFWRRVRQLCDDAFLHLENVSTCWAKSCLLRRWRGRGRHRAIRWPRTALQRAARRRAR